MVYVALLRAVNVGGRIVPMQKVKANFERLGLKQVRSFIASGNIIFEGSGNETLLTKRIETSLRKEFGIEIPVLLRNTKEMGRIVKALPNTWVNDKETKCDVMFLWGAIDRKSILKEFPINSAIEEMRYVKGAVLWRIPRKHASKSKIFRRVIGSTLHKQMTVRNPNTVRKLYTLMSK